MPAHLVEFAEGIDHYGGDSYALHEDDIEEMWFLGMVPDEVADAQSSGELEELVAHYRARSSARPVRATA